MIRHVIKRRLAVTSRDWRRFQPWMNTQHVERPREPSLHGKNLLPHHKKLYEQNDKESRAQLNKERLLQGRDFIDFWQKKSLSIFGRIFFLTKTQNY
mgnify:CR=1 FL=1